MACRHENRRRARPRARPRRGADANSSGLVRGFEINIGAGSPRRVTGWEVDPSAPHITMDYLKQLVLKSGYVDADIINTPEGEKSLKVAVACLAGVVAIAIYLGMPPLFHSEVSLTPSPLHSRRLFLPS